MIAMRQGRSSATREDGQRPRRTVVRPATAGGAMETTCGSLRERVRGLIEVALLLLRCRFRLAKIPLRKCGEFLERAVSVLGGSPCRCSGLRVVQVQSSSPSSLSLCVFLELSSVCVPLRFSVKYFCRREVIMVRTADTLCGGDVRQQLIRWISCAGASCCPPPWSRGLVLDCCVGRGSRASGSQQSAHHPT